MIERQRADARTPQRDEMRAAAERCADVLGQRAHIGAFAAGDAKRHVGQLGAQQFERVNRHVARRAFDDLLGRQVDSIVVAVSGTR